jgi:hypothetical protein
MDETGAEARLEEIGRIRVLKVLNVVSSHRELSSRVELHNIIAVPFQNRRSIQRKRSPHLLPIKINDFGEESQDEADLTDSNKGG